MRMLIYLGITLLGLLILAVGVLGILGSLVPEEHTASMSVELGKPIDEVWATIDDVANFPAWLPDITKVELLPDRNGHRTFRQLQGRNSFVLEETVKTPPTLVTRTITDDNGPFSGSWEHRFEDLGNGRTRLTVTEKGRISSPIPRAILHYMIGDDFYLKRFSQSLRSRFGS